MKTCVSWAAAQHFEAALTSLRASPEDHVFEYIGIVTDSASQGFIASVVNNLCCKEKCWESGRCLIGGLSPEGFQQTKEDVPVQLLFRETRKTLEVSFKSLITFC